MKSTIDIKKIAKDTVRLEGESILQLQEFINADFAILGKRELTKKKKENANSKSHFINLMLPYENDHHLDLLKHEGFVFALMELFSLMITSISVQ
ncbi:hypothetical protein N9Y26_01005 [bacterium]|nr:hypothetical protein [bacterium]